MAASESPVQTGDNAVVWYWPEWAAAADLPTLHVRDTESSHGRYARETKTILVKDLVKFHGHACDGLFRGVLALSLALDVLFPDQIVDRTDLRVLRNGPCLGTWRRILPGTGTSRPRTCAMNPARFVVQRIATGETVRVTENPGVYPAPLAAAEESLVAAGTGTPEALDALQAALWERVRTVLLTTPTDTLYTVASDPDFLWEPVPYTCGPADRRDLSPHSARGVSASRTALRPRNYHGQAHRNRDRITEDRDTAALGGFARVFTKKGS